MLPPDWERRLAGTTDSERYFLHLMWRLAERDGDMVAAIADTTADISRRYTASSLNAILLAPDALYAISFYDRSMVPAVELARLGRADQPEEVAAYFDLAYRVTGDAVVVASSGWPMPGWTPLPSGHVLVTDRRTLATSVRPITPSLPRPAGIDAISQRAAKETIIPNGWWLHRPPAPCSTSTRKRAYVHHLPPGDDAAGRRVSRPSRSSRTPAR